MGQGNIKPTLIFMLSISIIITSKIYAHDLSPWSPHRGLIYKSEHLESNAWKRTQH